jgi:hypothetical protein
MRWWRKTQRLEQRWLVLADGGQERCWWDDIPFEAERLAISGEP